MAKPKFPEFVRSTEFRRELGLKRKKAIRKMYSDIAKETENKINAIQRAGKWTSTTVLQMKQLRDLQKSIDDSLKNISAQIEKDIVSDMKKVAEVTCADVAGMMKRIGLNVGAAYAHVPELAVKNIVSGNLYGQRWNFSTAVWGDYRKASGDLAQIVARGLAQNRPIYDIAKDLEKYVNPNVRKDFDWSKRYPGSKKTVDYNAYRLAQTMSTHAHQQAVIIANRDNPLFDGVEWRSSGNSRTCPLCEQRNGEIFPFDKCPMDHPMGQCTLSPHLKTDSRTAAERIGDWIGGKSEDPELDKFAETLGYTDKSQMAVKPAQNTPSPVASANKASEKLAQMQKASDELGKAVKDFGKSVDGFEKAVDNLKIVASKVKANGNSLGSADEKFIEDIKETIAVIRGRFQAKKYNKLPAEFRSKIETALMNSNENVSNVIRNTLESSRIRQVSSHTYYYVFCDYIDINIDANPRDIAHEVFHRIDKINNITKRDEFLRKCLLKDYNHLKSESNDDIIKYMVERYPNAFYTNKYGKYKLHEEYNGISDIISGLTENSINLGFHHSEKYWSEDKLRCIEEAWANFGYVYFDNNPNVISMFEDLFPTFSYNVKYELRRLNQ